MCTRLHLTFTEIQGNPLKRLDALFSLLPKISTEVFLFNYLSRGVKFLCL